MNKRKFTLLILIFFTIILSNYIFGYKLSNSTLYAKNDKTEKPTKDKSKTTDTALTPTVYSSTTPVNTSQPQTDSADDTDIKENENRSVTTNPEFDMNTGTINSNNKESTEHNTINEEIIKNSENSEKTIDDTELNDTTGSNNNYYHHNRKNNLLNKNNTIDNMIIKSKKINRKNRDFKNTKHNYGFYVIKSYKKKSESSNTTYNIKTFDRILYFNSPKNNTGPKNNKVKNNAVTDKEIEPVSIHKKKSNQKKFWSALPLANSTTNNYTKGFGLIFIFIGIFKIIIFIKNNYTL